MLGNMDIVNCHFEMNYKDMQEELTNIERNSGGVKFDLSSVIIQTNITASTVLRDMPGPHPLKKIDAVQNDHNNYS